MDMGEDAEERGMDQVQIIAHREELVKQKAKIRSVQNFNRKKTRNQHAIIPEDISSPENLAISDQKISQKRPKIRPKSNYVLGTSEPIYENSQEKSAPRNRTRKISTKGKSNVVEESKSNGTSIGSIGKTIQPRGS